MLFRRKSKEEREEDSIKKYLNHSRKEIYNLAKRYLKKNSDFHKWLLESIVQEDFEDGFLKNGLSYENKERLAGVAIIAHEISKYSIISDVICEGTIERLLRMKETAPDVLACYFVGTNIENHFAMGDRWSYSYGVRKLLLEYEKLLENK